MIVSLVHASAYGFSPLVVENLVEDYEARKKLDNFTFNNIIIP